MYIGVINGYDVVELVEEFTNILVRFLASEYRIAACGVIWPPSEGHRTDVLLLSMGEMAVVLDILRCISRYYISQNKCFPL